MPNPYFRFKQFTVHQHSAAMKVCTDACLFGAWTASKKIRAARVLDIGTGTGLLSMMYIQKHPAANIDAVEVDADAAEEAAGNFSASPWKEQLHIHQTDIRGFDKKDYDLVITNPPFYENELLSAKDKRNIAMHHHGLLLNELVSEISKRLHPEGNAAILLPYKRLDAFIKLLQSSPLFMNEKILVRQTESHGYFRAMLILGRKEQPLIEDEITIRDNGEYSKEFTSLLKDYYLKF